jgi:hypothetical protein
LSEEQKTFHEKQAEEVQEEIESIKSDEKELKSREGYTIKEKRKDTKILNNIAANNIVNTRFMDKLYQAEVKKLGKKIKLLSDPKVQKATEEAVKENNKANTKRKIRKGGKKATAEQLSNAAKEDEGSEESKESDKMLKEESDKQFKDAPVFKERLVGARYDDKEALFIKEMEDLQRFY